MNQSEGVEEFWTALELRVGEDIEVYSLGEIKSRFRDLPPNTVGMFFITASALYFNTLPKQSWFDAVLRNVRSKKKESSSLLYSIPLKAISEVRVLGSNSLLRRFFSPNLISIKIFFTGEAGDKKEVLHFSLISRSRAEELVSLLEKNVVPGSST
jgi:hypothetical protein